LWPWFPIGPTGVRTAFLFGCGISILILRIAHYHVGLRTTGSGFSTLSASLTSFATYETILWYYVSAWVFCFVFLWSARGTDLHWITYMSGDRAKLNERPVFLACYLSVFALKQSVDHFKDDADRLDLNFLSQCGSKDGAESTSVSLKTMLGRLPMIFLRCFQRSAEVLGYCLVSYFVVLRPIAWRWALMFLRLLYKLPAASILPYQWPISISLFARCLAAGTLVSFIWTAGNEAFSIFMVKEPLKNGQPLTSDSKDPNGSLLNGLKSKKLSVKVCQSRNRPSCCRTTNRILVLCYVGIVSHCPEI
jgi:nucleoporin NDC1